MPHASLDHNMLVLLCDAGKALLLQNAGDSAFPKLEKRAEWETENLPAHERGSDRPGRTFSARQGRHSAIEPHDLKRIAEHQFLDKVVTEAAHLIENSKLKKLIVVAPPKVLGELRPLLLPSLARFVQAEIEKDYLRMPVYEIERHLSRLVKETQTTR